jgi:asparagine synthase (glutamine-hydrolysing)
MRLILGYFELGNESPSHAGAIVDRLRHALMPKHVQIARRSWLNGPITLEVLELGTEGPLGQLPGEGSSRVAADVRLDVPLDGEGDDAEQFARFLMSNGGEAALTPVLGDFASARWDTRASALTLACDGFAVRPLAYVYRPGRFVAFASLPRALRAAGLDDEPVDDSVMLGRCVNRAIPNVGVGGIKRVPPGHWVRFSASGVESAPFWQIDPRLAGTLDLPEEAASARLRELIEEAVRCRLPRSGRVGTHLSGGLDSSAITVFAARALREKGDCVHAFTHLERVRNDIPPPPDKGLAEQVLAQEPNVHWTPVYFARPRGDATPLCSDTIYSAAEDDINVQTGAAAATSGVRLILSGFGGNEAASYRGKDALAEYLNRGQWRRFARDIRIRRQKGVRWQSIIFNGLVPYFIGPRANSRLRRLFGRPGNVMATEAMADLLTAEGRKVLTNNPPRLSIRTPDSRVNRCRSLASRHIPDVVLHLADTGARHGVAYAFPLLDRRVVEFALALPVHLQQRGVVSRNLFRIAMAGVLPDDVRHSVTQGNARPGYAVDLLVVREQLLDRLAMYRNSERVRRLLDLDKMEKILREAPSADTMTAMIEHNDGQIAEIRSDIVLIGMMLDRAAHIAALEQN